MSFLILAAATVLDSGPAPDRTTAIAAAEAQIRATLVDPDSARFSWPYSIELIDAKPLLGHRTRSWTTCGTLNARNKMGGYAGTAFVKVSFVGGVLASFGVGEDDRLDPVQIVCSDMIKKGLIRPAVSPTPQPAEAFTLAEIARRGSVGIAFTPTPAGLLIAAVAPGSPADRAGLKPGETIAAVNGLALGGLDIPGAVAMLGRLPQNFTVDIVGVGPVQVVRTP